MGSEVVADSPMVLRIFLPTFFLVYILVLGPLSALAFKKKYGFDPLALQEPDPVMQFGEAYRNVLFGIVLLLTLVHAAWPASHMYLGPIRYLQTSSIQWVGMAVMVGSLLLVRAGQLQLKSSWRFGVDRAHPPDELITTGLFHASRNPIYLGMILTGVGLFLALPNAVTFAVPNLAFILLQTRVRAEETFMAEVYGSAYAAYRQRTPRWLIGPKG